MIVICTFCYDQETKHAAWAGNIPMQQALTMLQDLVIAEAVEKAKNTPALETPAKE